MNSFKNLFDTSPPRIVGYKMLFLCVGFAVPSTTRSLLLDDVVRDGESIQSQSVKIFGWIHFQPRETSTSAIDHSLVPIKKAS